ncbi:hypothetical protein KKB83_00260 [Patescibacteria group bacterium]|nr:hypothetical protein [Patescibacteria group bacterium]
MKIFVAGAWDPKIATHFQDEIEALGQLLAKRDHSVIMGPGSGIVRYIMKGFRSIPNRKGKIIFYLPKSAELIRTGEDLSPFADKIVKTNDDYLTRTLRMSRSADALGAITGGAGTLYEMIGMMFLKKPVAVLQSCGGVYCASRFLGGLRDYVKFARTPLAMIDYLETTNIKTNIPEDGIDWYDA